MSERRPEQRILHVRTCAPLSADAFQGLLTVLRGISPVVQAMPPGAALIDVCGAEAYFGSTAERLADLVRLRSVALLGVDVQIGVATTRAMAATACGQVRWPGGVLAVTEGEQERFLAPLPVAALDGIGPKRGAKLARYGLTTIGQLAAARPATVQRILGGRAGRLATDRARGIDPRRVVAKELPASARVQHRFERDVLEGSEARGVLLDLAVRLGRDLRGRRQAAGALTIQVRLADGAIWERTGQLKEPSAYTQDLRAAAYRLMDAAGLQRARITRLSLFGEDLRDADTLASQISFDHQREKGLVAEKTLDRINSRFGDGTVQPAATLRPAG
ncbi:hypothetical protein [Kitasatospora sp. NPDC050543]|uniref:DinB/UmuC family translesion DNA polymerase n=1 Tax=Kitasatospora sp. NPDC050543 TaxID=3364054 RepID=UPI0037A3C308